MNYGVCNAKNVNISLKLVFHPRIITKNWKTMCRICAYIVLTVLIWTNAMEVGAQTMFSKTKCGPACDKRGCYYTEKTGLFAIFIVRLNQYAIHFHFQSQSKSTLSPFPSVDFRLARVVNWSSH